VLRIQTLQQNVPGGAVRDASLEELHKLLTQQSRIVWVDLHAPTAEEATVLLREFRFHPVAVEDALEDNVHPKVDDYGDYLYVVLHGVLDDKLSEAEASVDMHEVDFFLGRNYIVTHHDQHSRSVEKVWERMKRQPEFFVGGPDFIFQAVVEQMIDRYMPVIEAFDERIDELEDKVFQGQAGPRVLEQIFGFKRTSLKLRRTVHPQREVIRNLSAGQYPLISKEAQILLRDVYDHLFTVAELIESYRDLLSGALDAHLSVTSNKMNEIMKTLTIITTVLMPIAVLSGIYGMNFDYMPFTGHWWGFFLVSAIMLSLGGSMVGFVIRRKWL
jgi:magnesium transporter